LRRVLGVLVLTALGVGLTVSSSQAGAEATCTHDPVTGRVDVTLHEGFVRIRRSGASIQFQGFETGGYQPCGGATVHNTDRIVFTDMAENDRHFGVDQSNGRFGPGMTAEDSGESEIEIFAHYSGHDYESMFLLVGTPGSDDIYMGAAGITVNRDSDIDIEVDGAGFQDADALAGNDFVSLSGGNGTGSPVKDGGFFGNTLSGGAGNDVLIGGPGLNTLGGGTDRDRLVGKGGRDSASGGPGADEIYGKKGPDNTLSGDEGNDHIEGGQGDDSLYGNAGNDHLDGDAGKDACNPGPGTDTREDCETT
jgi:Ca2+-binding RTX toxin-like protein